MSLRYAVGQNFPGYGATLGNYRQNTVGYWDFTSNVPVMFVRLPILIAKLRNHNATDDDNVDFRSFKKKLHSKLGKVNVK